MPDATHYTYRVAWSIEDGEHVATVAEFPSLSWLAPTPVEALAGLANVVRDVLAAVRRQRGNAAGVRPGGAVGRQRSGQVVPAYLAVRARSAAISRARDGSSAPTLTAKSRYA